MLSSIEKDTSNSRMASLGYLIASYQYIFPRNGYQAAKIANWIQNLASESDLDLMDVTDEEVNYVLLCSLLVDSGPVVLRNQPNPKEQKIHIHI